MNNYYAKFFASIAFNIFSNISIIPVATSKPNTRLIFTVINTRGPVYW